MHMTELAPDQERLGRSTGGAVVQSKCTAALHRDLRWLSEDGWPSQCVCKDGIHMPAVGGLLVQLTMRELVARMRPQSLPRRQLQRIGHPSRQTEQLDRDSVRVAERDQGVRHGFGALENCFVFNAEGVEVADPFVEGVPAGDVKRQVVKSRVQCAERLPVCLGMVVEAYE